MPDKPRQPDRSTNQPPVAIPGVQDSRSVTQALLSNESFLRAAAIYGRNTGELKHSQYKSSDRAAMRRKAEGEASLAAEWFNRLNPFNEASELPALRARQLARPPQEYVVRYYSWNASNQPLPQRTYETFSVGDEENPPEVYPGNSMQPLNRQMQEDVQDAFANIASQLPGRFRFVKVNDPAQADIQIAAVQAGEMIGVAAPSSGSLLLVGDEYAKVARITDPHISTSARDQLRNGVLHEVLHVMGLSHPHDRGRLGNGDKPVHAQATFFDTQMTYDENNAKGKGMQGLQTPVSLMPSDLVALRQLYPIARDGNGIAVGLASGVAQNSDIGATIRSGTVMRDVLLPDSGVVFQPQTDGRGDSVQLRAAAGATVQLKQNARGVMIGEPYLNTAAYLQFTPEQIRTSGGSDLVTLQNNASIYVERNRSHARDGIELRGSGNRISVPVGGEKSTQFTLHGDDYHFTLRNRGANIGRLPLINVNMGAGAQPATSSWTRDDAGHYQLTMAGGRQTRTIRFELEEPSARAIRQMDALMDRQYARAPQRPIVPPSVSATEAARARVHGTRPADFSYVEKQLLLEAAGYQTDGVTGRADGKVDGHYGATSQRAEASLRADLAAGRLRHLPADVLDDIRAAFSIGAAPSMRASDGNVQRPTGGNPTPPDRSNKR